MSEDDLSGKRALVTGGASGIGLACAREYARRGAKVTVADVNADAAHAVAAEFGGDAWVVDLADTTALDEIALDIDILVNNAGMQRVMPLRDVDPETFRLMLRLMLEAPFLLIRAALPAMFDRGWGRVINISSAHGLRASAALHGMAGVRRRGHGDRRVVHDGRRLDGAMSANELIDVPDALAGLRHPARLISVPRGLQDEEPGLYSAAYLARLLPAHAGVRHERVDGFNHYTIVLSDAGSATVAGVVREELELE